MEDPEAAIRINGLLHEYGEYIIGRMGIPYHEKQMNIISVVMDAPQEKVSALSGKLGMIPGVSTKCLYAPDAQKAPKIKRLSISSNLCYNCKMTATGYRPARV